MDTNAAHRIEGEPFTVPGWMPAPAVKIGQETYPARTDGTVTERNTKTSGRGAWIPA